VDELAGIIRDEIGREGPLTFARYMELALYHPALGYYAGGGSGREPVGWGGDYFTSGDVHPLWGWAIARRLHQMWLALGHPARFDVVEPGAGRGLLAREVWRYAVEREPAWAQTLSYTLVDRAPAGSSLRVAREERLRAELAAIAPVAIERTRWSDALPAGTVGCVVSNELADALPAHVLEKRGGTLREVYVTVDAPTGGFIETLGEPSSPEVAGYLDRYRAPWRRYPDGWRAEVCLAAEDWMRTVAASVERGYALTIDYGDTARRLYTPERRHGTLATYSRHHFGDQALAQPGRRDLTAHVNFSALVLAGWAGGLRLEELTTQAAFLERQGIRAEAEALGRRLYPAAETERWTDRGQADLLRRKGLAGAVATLLNPHGLGGFRVLMQRRGEP
jgi:SAM-dependent MidA family methyltransferase